ncbi:putative nucleic-acid-binding protein contains PIN domain (plasmid) [Rubrobacter radiotolerans]|uniref:Ribonuclease VapC n=1 Tax=Rubrobacter radiotolerans TaxID=42256 RepID=A0A023X8H3_RUBRA|nr:PIN domain-containing protein [Rubrobacter radiotolerans]AHY48340.1 putative nucleic-acid-binding protein contains PIN domain [Rubrobacter radiotolerans]MDX5895477.1 PIN domain-containing protein [Rubrobacter radiotolerans]SMC01538.1 Predicted nucleic acid-binding protein, contains PIN domain [Rubrobacter radiotolerans DSM 5868]
MKRFVDTNVLVYAYDRSAGEKHRAARALVEELWRTGEGCLSVQVLQEFYVSVTRKVRRPVSREEATGMVEDFLSWTVHSPLGRDVVHAAELGRRESLSFWDAMILTSARTLGCGVLLSEDLNPGQSYDGVKVVNPLRRESE